MLLWAMNFSFLEQLFTSFKVAPWLLVTIIALVIFAVGVGLGRLVQKISYSSAVKSERADAVKRSRAVLGGQFAEQLAPYFPNFPCNPGDCVFLGKPVDFVAFPGSAEGREITDVVFIEVKSGDSQLSEREKQIRTAIEKGRVHYIMYRIKEKE